tara:strand:+ start:179 stop:373 length:195 start_codon:yes stop_codon:yes gene_type:complete
MQIRTELLSEYISDGGFSTKVIRTTLNGDVMYQVSKNGTILGHYANEDEAETLAEESVFAPKRL